MSTKTERKWFAAHHLFPLVNAAVEDVTSCSIDKDEFVHIERRDGTDRMVCVAGCTFKEMTEKVLEHI